MSAVFFLLCALFMLLMGVLYLIWPIAPYHEGIIQMSAGELAGDYPEINKLMTTLVNLAGISFASLGVITAILGGICWKNRRAWYAMLSLIPVFLIPLTIFVAQAEGPVSLVIIPIVLLILALIFSGIRERQWE